MPPAQVGPEIDLVDIHLLQQAIFSDIHHEALQRFPIVVIYLMSRKPDAWADPWEQPAGLPFCGPGFSALSPGSRPYLNKYPVEAIRGGGGRRGELPWWSSG